MDSGIIEVGSSNSLDELKKFIQSLNGSISDKLDDFEKNSEIVNTKREEYKKLRRECEKHLEKIANDFTDWLSSAAKTRNEQKKRMEKYISKNDKKVSGETAVMVKPPNSVWNNFQPSKIKLSSGEIKPLSKQVSSPDKSIRPGYINGIELGSVRVVQNYRQIPNFVVYQLESDLKDEKRSKFFYWRVNGQLIQSSIPNRQKQGSLRNFKSCFNCRRGDIRCKDGADKCRFYHDPMLDPASTDVRNYPELSRYISCSAYTESGGDYSPSAYNDSIGDIDELPNDLNNVTGHEIYVFGQKTLGSFLCFMAATKRKPISYMIE